MTVPPLDLCSGHAHLLEIVDFRIVQERVQQEDPVVKVYSGGSTEVGDEILPLERQ